MPPRSSLRLASLMALSFVTLTACASASSVKPAPAPQIIERTRTVPVCPAEVRADVPAVPKVPDGAVISGNAAGQGWLSEIVGYAQSAFSRETDAQATCQKVDHG